MYIYIWRYIVYVYRVNTRSAILQNLVTRQNNSFTRCIWKKAIICWAPLSSSYARASSPDAKRRVRGTSVAASLLCR